MLAVRARHGFAIAAAIIILVILYSFLPSGYRTSHIAALLPIPTQDYAKPSSTFDASDDTNEQSSVETTDSHTGEPGEDGAPFTDRGDSVQVYHDLKSLTKSDHKYYAINMGSPMTTNANLLPHPVHNDMLVVVATNVEGWLSRALTCPVTYVNDSLVCETPAEPLVATPSLKGTCDGFPNAVKMNSYTGPRDTRVFWGPEAPYVMYASQSQFRCLGLWIQDAGRLLKPFQSLVPTQDFNTATEIQRPQNVVQTNATIEKNWFLFWDANNVTHVHYDIWPKRSFARVLADGSVGADLALTIEAEDAACMKKTMPVLNKDEFVKERIHQATNSLAISMCKRNDNACLQSSYETYIVHIFHRQRINNNHATYQPYVALLRNEAPFKLHAIGQKALWIHGRALLTEQSHAKKYIAHPHDIPKNHSEMFFITSMSWRSKEQRYQGFLDDALWINFGREDSLAGSIDVLASDLLHDLATC